jgi:hypothetical protein
MAESSISKNLKGIDCSGSHYKGPAAGGGSRIVLPMVVAAVAALVALGYVKLYPASAFGW